MGPPSAYNAGQEPELDTLGKNIMDRHPLAFLPFKRFRDPAPVVAVVSLAGIIGRLGSLQRGLNIAGVAPLLERAFAIKRLSAVALAINSPGGSPVQSALIAKRIRDLAIEHDVPVLAFCEDVAASGGYWLACAADEIHADANSIVGSIGVVSSGFGFTQMIEKLGIERRLHTAGERKAILDPFGPEREADVAHLKMIQTDMHDDFMAMVRERRGRRLKGDEDDLFSGAFWTGTRALDLGLVDGIGEMRATLRERFGDRVRIKRVEQRRSWFQRRFGVPGGRASADGGLWLDQALAAVEDRLIWNRFGL